MDLIYKIITVLLSVIPFVIGIANSLYLCRTRGYRSIRISPEAARRRHNQNKDEPIRCCYVSDGVMWSYIGLYYLILTVIGLVVNVIYDDLVSTVATICSIFMVECIVLILEREQTIYTKDRYVPHVLKTATLSNIVAFSGCCFFWLCIALSIACINLDCTFGKTFFGFEWVWIIYVLMLIEAYRNRSDVLSFDKISRSEAFERMKNTMKEEPQIRWEAECGHYEKRRKNTRYVMLHKEQLTYPVNQYSSIEIKTPSGPPDKVSFKSEYTKLLIKVSIHPGDTKVQEHIIQRGKAFKDSHVGHDEMLSFPTQNHFLYRYIVTDNDSPLTWLNWKWYILFAVLGLSTPYRIFLYCKLGHAKFSIVKYVYSEDYAPLPTVCTTGPITTVEIPETVGTTGPITAIEIPETVGTTGPIFTVEMIW